jgi:hypothetical protein
MTSGPRFYFVCYPDTNHTIGGVKQIYRQVELLNEFGLQAFVLQENPGFRVTWFPSRAPVIDIKAYLHDPPNAETDWIILPETWVSNIPTYLPGIRKVIFNQNAYYTFGLEGEVNSGILQLYRHPDVRAIVTVSDDNKIFLVDGCGLPADKIYTLINGINSDMFYPPERKLRRIVYLARKHVSHARSVRVMAAHHPFLHAYEFKELPKLSHQELAAELREALVFLSCGHPEGFGLPLAEAIACGCITVGYHGLGGRDFSLPALHQVEYGDLAGFVSTLARVIESFEADPAASISCLIDHALLLRSRYSFDAEKNVAYKVWSAIAEF